MQKGFAPVILILIITGLILVGGFWAYQNNFQNIRQINSFEGCQKAGYHVLKTYPSQCSTPDGKHFSRQLSDEEIKKLQPIEEATGSGTPLGPRTGAFFKGVIQRLQLQKNSNSK